MLVTYTAHQIFQSKQNNYKDTSLLFEAKLILEERCSTVITDLL